MVRGSEEQLNVEDHKDTLTVNTALDATRQGVRGGLPPG